MTKPTKTIEVKEAWCNPRADDECTINGKKVAKAELNTFQRPTNWKSSMPADTANIRFVMTKMTNRLGSTNTIGHGVFRAFIFYLRFHLCSSLKVMRRLLGGSALRCLSGACEAANFLTRTLLRFAAQARLTKRTEVISPIKQKKITSLPPSFRHLNSDLED